MRTRVALLLAISVCAVLVGCAPATEAPADVSAGDESLGEVGQALPWNAYVTLYEHCSYQGAAHTFSPPLDYNSFAHSPNGDQNDRYSSIRVYGGAKVSLFEHINYQGREVTFDYDNPCFTGVQFNDLASSLAWWTW